MNTTESLEMSSVSRNRSPSGQQGDSRVVKLYGPFDHSDLSINGKALRQPWILLLFGCFHTFRSQPPRSEHAEFTQAEIRGTERLKIASGRGIYYENFVGFSAGCEVDANLRVGRRRTYCRERIPGIQPTMVEFPTTHSHGLFDRSRELW